MVRYNHTVYTYCVCA